MVLKVFITTGDEISLSLWLPSTNHIGLLWMRLCFKGNTFMHTHLWWRERERHRNTHTERDRETEIDGDRETERDREEEN